VGLTVLTQHHLGGVYRSLGDYRQAAVFFRKNVACLQGALLHARFGQYHLVSVFSRSFLATCLAECGAFSEGRELAAEGGRIAEAAEHPYSCVLTSWALGFLLLRQGDLTQAIPELERALDLAQGAYIRLAVPLVMASLGVAYALMGRTAEALPLLEQGVARATAMDFILDHALRVVWLGEAYLRAGRLEEASTEAQRALEFARAHQERGNEAYALHLLGDIAAQREPLQVEQPAAYYHQTLALTEELGMRPLQAHCHQGLGMLYTKLGQWEQARTELSTAIEMYRSMDMTFWLPQAEAVLAQVEGR
jgi:tetratricopeptide (TPR) repeat protein